MDSNRPRCPHYLFFYCDYSIFEYQLKTVSKCVLLLFFAVVFVTSCTDFYVGSFDDPQDEKLKAVSIAQIAQDVFERFYGPGTWRFIGNSC